MPTDTKDRHDRDSLQRIMMRPDSLYGASGSASLGEPEMSQWSLRSTMPGSPAPASIVTWPAITTEDFNGPLRNPRHGCRSYERLERASVRVCVAILRAGPQTGLVPREPDRSLLHSMDAEFQLALYIGLAYG